MVDLHYYKCEFLKKKMRPYSEELFIDSYAIEYCEFEPVHNATKQILKILDTKYDKSHLDKIVNKNCKHFSVEEWTR